MLGYDLLCMAGAMAHLVLAQNFGEAQNGRCACNMFCWQGACQLFVTDLLTNVAFTRRGERQHNNIISIMLF